MPTADSCTEPAAVICCSFLFGAASYFETAPFLCLSEIRQPAENRARRLPVFRSFRDSPDFSLYAGSAAASKASLTDYVVSKPDGVLLDQIDNKKMQRICRIKRVFQETSADKTAFSVVEIDRDKGQASYPPAG